MITHSNTDIMRSLRACASDSCETCALRGEANCIRRLINESYNILQTIPDPQNTAQWEKLVDTHNWSEYKCSKCGRIARVTGARHADLAHVYHVLPYCHCGTRMMDKNGK